MRLRLSIWMLVAVLSLSLTGFGQDETEKKEDKAPDAPALQPKQEENTPEGALKKFLNSMATLDAEGLKSVAIPNDELEILVAGEKPTAMDLARIQLAIAVSPMTRLKVGDEIKLPGGRNLVIDEKLVNKNRQSISAMGAPVPFDVQLIEDKWKVNPQPLIAARKAAKKAMERNKQREDAEKKTDK